RARPDTAPPVFLTPGCKKSKDVVGFGEVSAGFKLRGGKAHLVEMRLKLGADLLIVLAVGNEVAGFKVRGQSRFQKKQA
ncbi:hypothetical protein ACEQ6C_40350, partial [Rhizobium ruizarguesonis]